MVMKVVRIWIPVAILSPGSCWSSSAAATRPRSRAAAALWGAGLRVALLNWLHRMGVSGDRAAREEDEARAYFARHGRWPDDAAATAGVLTRQQPDRSALLRVHDVSLTRSRTDAERRLPHRRPRAGAPAPPRGEREPVAGRARHRPLHRRPGRPPARLAHDHAAPPTRTPTACGRATRWPPTSPARASTASSRRAAATSSSSGSCTAASRARATRRSRRPSSPRRCSRRSSASAS